MSVDYALREKIAQAQAVIDRTQQLLNRSHHNVPRPDAPTRDIPAMVYQRDAMMNDVSGQIEAAMAVLAQSPSRLNESVELRTKRANGILMHSRTVLDNDYERPAVARSHADPLPPRPQSRTEDEWSPALNVSPRRASRQPLAVASPAGVSDQLRRCSAVVARSQALLQRLATEDNVVVRRSPSPPRPRSPVRRVQRSPSPPPRRPIASPPRQRPLSPLRASPSPARPAATQAATATLQHGYRLSSRGAYQSSAFDDRAAAEDARIDALTAATFDTYKRFVKR